MTKTKKENTREADAALLLRAIRKSGLTLPEFAFAILARDERTIRRYRDGDMRMPSVLRRYLREYVK